MMKFLGKGMMVAAAMALLGNWSACFAAEVVAPAASATGLEAFCTVTGEPLKYLPPSSRRMAGLLEKLAATSDPRINTFLNRQRAEMLRSQLAQPSTNLTQTAMNRAQLAMELLNAGESAAAIAEFDEVERLQKQNPSAFGARFLSDVRQFQALANLRIGEQENCLTNHTSASCILPIQPEGVHKLQRGSRKAIEILLGQLNQQPRDRKAAWLLNIAYMTVGEYPSGVPAGWRIPEAAFKSDYNIKRFPDIAANLGLDTQGYAGGTIAEDFDGDGYVDLMTSDWSLRGPLRYFHNNRDGSFSNQSVEAGLTGLVGGLGIMQGDYNNDGLPDVLVMRGAWLNDAGNLPDSLLRNDGNGHFTDVTEEAGLLSFDPNQAAVWLDFDGDGWLDIYFGYESFGNNIHPCKLFRNNHDGTFTECAAAAGVAAVGFVKGVVAGDFNNDGRPDLYLSLRGQPNILFRNDGPRSPANAKGTEWKFTDVSIQAGVTEPIASFPTWFFDYDNDGWEDIFVSGYSTKDVGDIAADYLGAPNNGERVRLYHNNHDGTFQDVTKEMNLYKVILTMGANFGDLDNDGWLDMLLSTGDPNLATLVPDRAFRNDGGKRFQDVTTSGGFGHLQKGHGVSFADFNNDGKQDIFHCVGGAYEGDFYRSTFYENPGHGNHWLTLKLEGVESNRIAVGARIKVVAKGPAGERSIWRTVGTGGSFGANPLRQEIGLGDCTSVDRVEIQWPVTGKTQVVKNLLADRFYRIREGDELAVDQKLKTFPYAKGRGKDHLHTTAK